MKLEETHSAAEMTAEGLIVPALVVIVGQACTLRCKNCSNFSPYAPDSMKRYPLERLKGDLQVVFDASHYVKKIQVQGGEPLLYTQLPQLLAFIRDSGKVGTITIATNGTILPSEEVLQALERCRVRVRISSYPVVPPEKTDRLVRCLEARGIETWTYEFAARDAMWYDMGGIDARPEGSDDAVQARFLQCPFHDCFTLEDGKISRCSRAVIAEQVQGFTARTEDVLPVVPAEDFPARLWDYLRTPEHMEACRYCYGAQSGEIPPAQQL